MEKTILKDFLSCLGFLPKENSQEIYYKKYSNHNNYLIEIDLKQELIDYGDRIDSNNKTTQNFTQSENFVVLECVNRLLEKGYFPEDLTLEKTFPSGHGHSGRLDILVRRQDKAFLMIECKTFGSWFKKELDNINKNGGQLFTYYQNDRASEYLILYASKFDKNKIEYINEIVNIEESYRETSNVKDLFERWNKTTKNNGIFESWVEPYHFESKALTLEQLKPIKEKDSSFIFNRFLEILRHNVVSDKPNAFNKVFTLFLCKIIDEQDKNKNDEMEFQWIEGKDTHITFQTRLTDLYRRGMKELLSKEVTDLSEKDFNDKFKGLEESVRDKILEEITRLRLQKNNEFAIKEVFDDETFEENAKVLKEVVELLQNYQFRYNKKQQYLSNFFELLLTTGLKQESGQFFTPVSVARFICKSIPLDKIIMKKLNRKDFSDLLPNVIDYATGSGHFLIESMDEIQQIISDLNEDDYNEKLKKQILSWKNNEFSWAYKYIYGIEQDYRLVKTAKVGCYLNGDGIANVIIGDGLDNFLKSKSYRGKLSVVDKDFKQDNKQFDVVISNPPYSVSAFKSNFKDSEQAKEDFDLFTRLTDQSSEIECLFIERTKQLLNETGMTGIILPSSILSNTGIYSKTREILLKYFKIKSIVCLGSGTFMATGTNTVTLFLERRNDYEWINIKNSIESFSNNLKDVTVDGFENIFSKYVKHTFEDIDFKDFITIFQNSPNQKILDSEMFKEYKKGIKHNSDEELLHKIIEIEKEKLLYFILSFNQKVVLVKSGEKKKEKEFLGYEFSNRRGSEGIHPIQRGKTIDECTKLFNPNCYDDETKVSTYIYDAFENKFDREINEELIEHISRVNLVDMLTFNRVEFEKIVSVNVHEKIEIETKWDLVKLGDLVTTQYGFTDKANDSGNIRYLRITDLNDDGTIKNYNKKYINPNQKIENQYTLGHNDIVIARSGSVGKSAIYKNNKYEKMLFASYLIRLKTNDNINPDYLFNFTKSNYYWDQVNINMSAVTQPNLNAEKIKEFKIPLPPKEIQNKIISKIEELERLEEKSKEKIEELEKEIEETISFDKFSLVNLSEITFIEKGTSISKKNTIKGEFPVIAGGKGPAYYHNESNRDKNIITVSASGANSGFVNYFSTPIFASDCNTIKSKNESLISTKLIYVFLCLIQNKIYELQKGQAQPHVYANDLRNIKIPLPSIDEQKKIVEKIEKIEKEIETLENQLKEIPKQKEEILKKYL